MLFKSGKFATQQAKACRLEVDTSTLRYWFKVYSTFGLETLLENQFKGNHIQAYPI